MKPDHDEIRSSLPPPAAAASTLARGRLTEGLMASGSARLVILRAPAGYSKTTTLRLWDETDRRPFAWVRCGAGHDDPGRLVEATAAALDAAGIAPESLEPQSLAVPDIPLASRRLCDSITVLDPFVLVVDDAHLLCHDAAWPVLDSLIDALPDGALLAVATRSEPRLKLGRRRVQGKLYELETADLALTGKETRDLLSTFDPDLARRADEIHRLTEGWPAAVYLAALALGPNRDTRLKQSSGFSGSDRTVVDYIHDEFFRELPDETAGFLCRTSILDELTGPLCDAVTDRTDSSSVLPRLARGNALVVALDRGATRFRYHHLFQEMLRSELRSREPQAEPGLHRRAAVWLAANGDIPRATDHAVEAGDFGLAGALIWINFPATSGLGRVATLDRWFGAIGDDQARRVPALILSRAHREIMMGRGGEMFAWLSLAESEIGEESPLYGDRFILRATIGPDGPAEMIADARRGRELVSPLSPWRIPARLYEGIGLFLTEDDAAVPLLRETAREATLVSPIIQVMALIQLALDELDRDRIETAADHILRARDQLEHPGLRVLRVMALAYSVLSLVRARQGRVDDAVREFETSRQIGAGIVDFIPWLECELALASCESLIRVGKLDLAAAFLKEAEDAVVRLRSPSRAERWLARCRERLNRARGESGSNGFGLTTAEMRTLRYLPGHHSFREIGELLFLSQNTIKTQAGSLYRKLGVNSRAEAVMVARRRGLLDE